MSPEEMKTRTKAYGTRIARMVQALPNSKVVWVISDHLLRSGFSSGANYRAACRAKSNADFIAKMGIVEEEVDETLFFMEVLLDLDLVTPKRIVSLMKEGEEILSIVVASIKTARNGR